MALVENLQREELNPIEVALGYQRLIEECNLTQEQVAQKVGKNRATVANMLRLLKLPPRIQASLRDGTISIGHARALINVEEEELQILLVREIEEKGLSVREVEDRVRELRRSEDEASEAAQEAEPPVALPEPSQRDVLQLQEFTSRLRSLFSTQVAIKHKGDGGKIEIAYYSSEDLERIMEMLLRA